MTIQWHMLLLGEDTMDLELPTYICMVLLIVIITSLFCYHRNFAAHLKSVTIINYRCMMK